MLSHYHAQLFSHVSPFFDAEQIVHIPINNNKEDHNSTTLTNQTGRSNRTSIIICIILAITGQSIARLLETFYHHHNIYWSLQDGIWTQHLLHVIGFPLLILPFFSSKKHNQLLITSNPSSLALLYLCTGVTMVVHIKLYTKGKLEIPSTKFILYEGTQLYFTTLFAGLVNRIRFNTWIVISLIFTLAITVLSFNVDGECSALLSAITFSFLLSNIHVIFHNFVTNSKNKKPRFTYVLELLIFSSLFATVASVFIPDENIDLTREMDGFSKGKSVYIMTIIGQAVSWQIYWVGLVGLVLFVDSIVTSNVESVGLVVSADSIMTANIVSLSTYPVVMVLKIMFCNYEDDEFDGFLVASLALFAISVGSCFYKHVRVLREIGNWKPPRLLWFLFVWVICIAYMFVLSDHYIYSPTGFESL
ncbi:unnamed protein product [Eruca vesicaria subsp. sativa]|uniref:Probable purine permease n=1 Tax=Eruca vesicaria subsp. sativa TaxID=29727 RepID=A0ABC8JDI8_ERUVS|nr:unnamed protein product [Eruca vesicaria subsp. sativa]